MHKVNDSHVSISGQLLLHSKQNILHDALRILLFEWVHDILITQVKHRLCSVEEKELSYR